MNISFRVFEKSVSNKHNSVPLKLNKLKPNFKFKHN